MKIKTTTIVFSLVTAVLGPTTLHAQAYTVWTCPARPCTSDIGPGYVPTVAIANNYYGGMVGGYYGGYGYYGIDPISAVAMAISRYKTAKGAQEVQKDAIASNERLQFAQMSMGNGLSDTKVRSEQTDSKKRQTTQTTSFNIGLDKNGDPKTFATPDERITAIQSATPQRTSAAQSWGCRDAFAWGAEHHEYKQDSFYVSCKAQYNMP